MVVLVQINHASINNTIELDYSYSRRKLSLGGVVYRERGVVRSTKNSSQRAGGATDETNCSATTYVRAQQQQQQQQIYLLTREGLRCVRKVRRVCSSFWSSLRIPQTYSQQYDDA